MNKFPNDTKIRTLQFDSFFIECAKKSQDAKRMNLLPNEAYWLYKSGHYIHDFVRRATLDTKLAVLAKLGYHYSVVVYDDDEGCSMIKWSEQIRAAKGLETAQEWFDNFSQFSHTFVIGGYEVRRILTRLEVMYHAKMFRISRYITRLKDLKRLSSYESLRKEDDFISFILKVALGFTKISVSDTQTGLNRKELSILLLLYLEHRFLSHDEIDREVKQVSLTHTTAKSLDRLTKEKLVEKTKHPYNRGSKHKQFSYLITESGLDVVRSVSSKILMYL